MLVECKSRDGITIGLFDALITIAHTLRERLDREAARMKRVNDRDPEKWEWFSDEVEHARADAACVLSSFIYPRDEKAMAIIHGAAELLKKDHGERKMAALTVAEWSARTPKPENVRAALNVLLRNTGWDNPEPQDPNDGQDD